MEFSKGWGGGGGYEETEGWGGCLMGFEIVLMLHFRLTSMTWRYGAHFDRSRIELLRRSSQTHLPPPRLVSIGCSLTVVAVVGVIAVIGVLILSCLLSKSILCCPSNVSNHGL